VRLAEVHKARREAREEAERRELTRATTAERLNDSWRRQEAVFVVAQQAQRAAEECAELDPMHERFNSSPQLQRL
jgi:hypothetical protein